MTTMTWDNTVYNQRNGAWMTVGPIEVWIYVQRAFNTLSHKHTLTHMYSQIHTRALTSFLTCVHTNTHSRKHIQMRTYSLTLPRAHISHSHIDAPTATFKQLTNTLTSTHTCTHQHPHPHTLTQISTHFHKRSYTLALTSTNTHTHKHSHTRTHTHTHTRTHTYPHTPTHAPTHTHPHIPTHTHTHSHINTEIQPRIYAGILPHWLTYPRTYPWSYTGLNTHFLCREQHDEHSDDRARSLKSWSKSQASI